MTTESLKEDGRPAQQWYWDDWFSAFDVRLCSLAARGLWIDMIGIMWKAEIRGTLTINGQQIDSKTLAKIVGDEERNIDKLLKELEERNVYSRLDDGTIICRRMFKESKKKEEISRIRSEAGKKGAESRWQNNDKKEEEKMAKMAASSSTPSSSPTLNKEKTSCSKNPSERAFKYSETHKNLAKLLELKIRERMPRHRFPGKQYIEEWANEFRLMEERKEATAEEIEKLIIWVSKSDFWYRNIRSAEKLRKQFGRLWAEMEDEAKKCGKKVETSEEFISRQKKALEGR